MDHGPAASALVLLWRVPDAVAAALVAGLLALGLRSFVRIVRDRDRPPLVTFGRTLAGGGGLAAGAALASLAVAVLPGSRSVVVSAGLAFLGIVGSCGLPAMRAPLPSGLGPLLATAVMTAMAVVLLLPAGLLRVEPGQPAVLMVLSGEARRELVRWAPAGLPLREEGLRAHRVLLQAPEGRLVGEAWLYGSAGYVGAEAFCSAAGGPCLLRLESLRNDAPAEAHNARHFPPQTVAVEARGSAIVPGWWPPWQHGLLRGLGLLPREVGSARLPLLDSQGLPIRAGYPLTLQGGRLTAP